jgi:hypothetical protein
VSTCDAMFVTPGFSVPAAGRAGILAYWDSPEIARDETIKTATERTFPPSGFFLWLA